MTYDNWKTTNPDDEWLGPASDNEDPDMTCSYYQQELLAALKGLLRTRGKPHAEEYVDGGASYKAAVEAYNRAEETIKLVEAGDIICPQCRGERRIKGHLCSRCNGAAQIARSSLRHDEQAPFEAASTRKRTKK